MRNSGLSPGPTAHKTKQETKVCICVLSVMTDVASSEHGLVERPEQGAAQEGSDMQT